MKKLLKLFSLSLLFLLTIPSNTGEQKLLQAGLAGAGIYVASLLPAMAIHSIIALQYSHSTNSIMIAEMIQTYYALGEANPFDQSNFNNQDNHPTNINWDFVKSRMEPLILYGDRFARNLEEPNYRVNHEIFKNQLLAALHSKNKEEIVNLLKPKIDQLEPHYNSYLQEKEKLKQFNQCTDKYFLPYIYGGILLLGSLLAVRTGLYAGIRSLLLKQNNNNSAKQTLIKR